ncbi:hypothetical protein WG915_02870 [Corynebacterium sp. H128]|uniref:hypothetical protein n=1 Tax=Corynebacterium sp. H128 TaxID=3133427 RepID=UPI00309E9C82
MTTTNMKAFGSALALSTLLTACSAPEVDSPTAELPALGQPLSETMSASPRILISHQGGLITLDEKSGTILHQVDQPGFYRLAGAGDGRHIMVTNGNEFQVYDAAISEQPHGDHSHYYAGTPALTSASFTAAHAGHVVTHAGKTALFADGSGEVQTFDPMTLADAKPQAVKSSVGEAHHGVAVPLSDGSMLHTKGTEKERHTIVQIKDGKESAVTTDCPGVHGEATTMRDTVVFGCTNGPIIFRDGQFHKIPAAGYQRNGNLAGSPVSPIVLSDEKVDKDADAEHPTKVALIDSENSSYRSVELGSSYWFRSLARGPKGEALVLTYNGELNVIDQETGEVTKKIPAISAWEEKENWQEPGPILQVAGEKAYVTDAANKKLVVIDLVSGKVEKQIQLEVAPVEMSIATGKAPNLEEARAPHRH